MWAYTLLLPSFADIGIVGQRILTDGPWGLALLRPQHLLGLELPPLVHGVVWSLMINILCYVGFSLRQMPTPIERLQANLFVPSELTPITPSFRLWRSSVTVEELSQTVARYLGEERTRAAFESFAKTGLGSIMRPCGGGCWKPDCGAGDGGGRNTASVASARRRFRSRCAAAPSRSDSIDSRLRSRQQ